MKCYKNRVVWLSKNIERLRQSALKKILRKISDHYALRAQRSYPKGTARNHVLTECFWDNPNHYLRLHLFLEALSFSKEFNVCGVAYKKNSDSTLSMKSIGIEEMYFLEEFGPNEVDETNAKNILAKISSLKSFIELELPYGIPAYTIYDTVLKTAREPSVAINSNFFYEKMVEFFRVIRFYENIFNRLDIEKIVLSHPWKIEYVVPIFIGFKRGIESYHLNAAYENIRIKKLSIESDYSIPLESLPYSEYNAINYTTKRKISEIGREYLKNRKHQINTDINHKLAHDLSNAKSSCLSDFAGSKNKVVTICCHAWFDFPHAFGMTNFTDFLDWIELTVEHAINDTSKTWVLKSHPTQEWYGGFDIKKHFDKLPAHVRVVEHNTPMESLLDVSAYVVTIHGSVAFEAAAKGIPVLCGDKSYYTDWNFAKTANSRQEYIRLLSNLECLGNVSESAINDSYAFAYLLMSASKNSNRQCRFLSDSEGYRLHIKNIFYYKNRVHIDREIENIAVWIDSDTNSYSVFSKLAEEL